MQLNPTEISDLIKSRIEQFEAVAEARTEGTIVSLSDGIARIHGLADVMQGEMIEFPGNVYGMALNLERDSVGAVVLGDYKDISEGDSVKCTGRILEVPVGEGLLGRVVDSLGSPIDGKGPIDAAGTSPIEKIAPGVIARQSVDQPVQTGLKSIDSMVPIGRGQRELIIGDHRCHHQPEGHRHQMHLRRHRPEELHHCQRRAQAGRARRHGAHHHRGRGCSRIGCHAVHCAVFRLLHG
jgi:F-type H+-transporting ATPase subunit alpha